MKKITYSGQVGVNQHLRVMTKYESQFPEPSQMIPICRIRLGGGMLLAARDRKRNRDGETIRVGYLHRLVHVMTLDRGVINMDGVLGLVIGREFDSFDSPLKSDCFSTCPVLRPVLNHHFQVLYARSQRSSNDIDTFP